jgi:serine protease Do
VVGRLVEDEDKDKTATNDKPPSPGTSKEPEGGAKQAMVGVKLAPLDDALRKTFSLDQKVKGVVVLEVDPASPAALKGIRVGDVIVEAAQDAVTTTTDLLASFDKVRKSGRKAILLRVEDAKGDLRFVAIPLQ